MCEFKEKDSTNGVVQGEKMKLTVATIEGGGGNFESQPEPLKGVEYFETALEATSFGKFNYFVILLSGIILANVLLETLGMSFVLPVSQCDLNLSIQARGILSAIGFAGIISSSHLWGFLADTTGRRRIIRPTLLLAFFVTVLSSFATNFWLLVVLRYVNGFCISGGSATIYAYLSEFHTTKNRGRAIMGAAFIFGVGAMMLPLIAWLVINQEWQLYIPLLNITYKPWRLFIIVCGVPGFLSGLCLFKIPESPKFLLSQGKEEETLRVLSLMYRLNTGKPSDEFPVSRVIEDLDTGMHPKSLKNNGSNALSSLLRSMWSQTQPLFNREHMRTTILICSIQFWIFVTSNGMYMWFPHILNSVAGYQNEHPGGRAHLCEIVYQQQTVIFGGENSTDVGEAVDQCSEKLEIATYQNSLILEVLYALGFALIGGIINNVGKMGILFFTLAACGACGIVAVFIDIPVVAIYLYLVLLLCGLGINVLSAATVDLYPTRLRAMAVCISLMMGRLGSVVGANIMGALLSNHCEVAFISSGASLIISAFLGFFIPVPKKHKNAKEGSPRRTSLISMTGN